MKVCILDYGSGNIKSVYNLLNYLNYPTIISNKKNDILNCTHIILPGVGSFRSSMEKIKSLIPLGTLEKEVINFEKPFLGICVGMQLLATKGHEVQETNGLGWIDGEVKRISAKNIPLPHIGWQSLKIKNKSQITNNIDNLDFYFVHSYAFNVKKRQEVLACTIYGEEFCSIVQKKNIIGVQFHPEKSQQAGIKIFQNFLSL